VYRQRGPAMSKLLVAAVFLTLSIVTEVNAQRQTANITHIQLQKADVPASNYEVRLEILEISPGVVARHTHPGPTMVYVLEGGVTLLIDGSPSRSFSAGDSFLEPAGLPHEAYADKPSKIMVVFVVPKGSPLVIPATK
jgi:quercetin dioxygenase-like cupin family protein